MVFFTALLLFLCVNLVAKTEADAHLKVVLRKVNKLSETWPSNQLFQPMKGDRNQYCCDPEVKAYLHAISEGNVQSADAYTEYLSINPRLPSDINQSLDLETKFNPVAVQLKVFVLAPKCGPNCSIDRTVSPAILDEFGFIFSPGFKTSPDGVVTVSGQFSGMSLLISVASFVTDSNQLQSTANVSDNVTSDTTPISVSNATTTTTTTASTLPGHPCPIFSSVQPSSGPKYSYIYQNVTIGLGILSLGLLSVVAVEGILLYHFVRKHRKDKRQLVKDSSSDNSNYSNDTKKY